MGILGRLERYRGKGQPARRLRRRLRSSTRDRTVTALAGVLGTASVLSLMPGSVQQSLQFAVCKAVTVGVGRCRPVDLDVPPLPLPPARCPGLASVAADFPVLVDGSRRRFGELEFDRLVTSDGAAHWLASDAARLPGGGVAAGVTERVETGPSSLPVPLDASWSFTSSNLERDFAASVFRAATRARQVRDLGSLAARFGPADSASALTEPTERQARVVGLPGLPAPLAPPSATTATTRATGTTSATGASAAIGADPRTASVSVDEVTGAATTTVGLLGWSTSTPAAGAGDGAPAGMMQLDDDTEGRVSRVRMVLLDQHPSRVTLTFVDVQAGSDADATTLDRWANGTWGGRWEVAALAPLTSPRTDAAPWQQIFWSGASAVRVTLETQDPSASAAASAEVERALGSWPQGYLGANIWPGLLGGVQQLGPVAGARRTWLDQPGCTLEPATSSGPDHRAGHPPRHALRYTRPAPVQLRFARTGCTSVAPESGWEQQQQCVGSEGANYRVQVSSRISALEDPALVAAAMLAARRTGSAPGTAVTGEVRLRWLGEQRATRVAFRSGDGVPQRFGALVTGTVPGGGTGAMLVTSDGPLDPSLLETAVAALSSIRTSRR